MRSSHRGFRRALLTSVEVESFLCHGKELLVWPKLKLPNCTEHLVAAQALDGNFKRLLNAREN